MSRKRDLFKTFVLHKVAPLAIATVLLVGGGAALWAATLEVPSFESFAERKVLQSTKIYDRTGAVVLFDVHQDIKRKVVPFSEISDTIKEATLAIEDDSFYSHHGIKPSSILRALLADIKTGSFSQGGSTITQQVIKNVLLTQEQTITRKIKEAILAIKLERTLSKDQIFELYLNESPYGGNMYGVEEASQTYFGKKAKEVTLAEAAYLAGIPKAPSRYYPYGTRFKDLVTRKNLVLSRMETLGYITKEEAVAAKEEDVHFLPASESGIKAPHFALYVREYLEEKYGKDAIETDGLRVITTLDWNLQKKAEGIVAEYGKDNEVKFNAHNAAMVGIDPKTGQILVMVGSRDYFDTENDGNFNITLAKRQPGSSFKPVVYATAFKKGYTPDTVVFDVKTQFSTNCDADGNPLGGAQAGTCYMPGNYDNDFRGPMTLRNALAQSINIPALKALYLVGIKAALETARDLGITSLTDPTRYGLTLVLGGGEVSPLELTSAYAVFANDGVRHPYASILRVEDSKGNVLEEFIDNPTTVLDPQVAREINSILSDDVARKPAYGENSVLSVPGREVAAKTGTTNDYRDAWIMGYTPNFALGAWAGNNDNSPMEKKVAGFIVAPMWNAFMKEALAVLPDESFTRPEPLDPNLKPVLRGVWQGGETYTVDKTTGKLATEFTPPENREERYVRNVHDILHWVNRANPLGPAPSNPGLDSQYHLWEAGVTKWLASHGMPADFGSKPTEFDTVHTQATLPVISITSPTSGAVVSRSARLSVNIVRKLSAQAEYPLVSAEYYLNGAYLGVSTADPFSFSFTPENASSLQTENDLKVVAKDSIGNRGSATVHFTISD